MRFGEQEQRQTLLSVISNITIKMRQLLRMTTSLSVIHGKKTLVAIKTQSKTSRQYEKAMEKGTNGTVVGQCPKLVSVFSYRRHAFMSAIQMQAFTESGTARRWIIPSTTSGKWKVCQLSGVFVTPGIPHAIMIIFVELEVSSSATLIIGLQLILQEIRPLSLRKLAVHTPGLW